MRSGKRVAIIYSNGIAGTIYDGHASTVHSFDFVEQYCIAFLSPFVIFQNPGKYIKTLFKNMAFRF